MDTSKILSANILDLIFDDRNKEYGAYELRVTYPKRIKKSLLITFAVGVLVFGGAVLANSFQPKDKPDLSALQVTIQDLKQDEPEPIPEPEKKPEPIQTRTEILTPPNIVEDKDVIVDPPTQDDYKDAKIDVVKTDGVADEGLANIEQEVGDGKGIIEATKPPDLPFTAVEVEAKCACDWEKFLRKNLDPQVPSDNGAPEGRYTVIIQFVVDVDGTVSDIKPLTSQGYGMEQEAVRVLKRAMKWEPAYQNKMHVKAYRKQPITFEVN